MNGIVPTPNQVPRLEDDGLPTPEIGSWGLEKYARVWTYDEIFARGMKAKWDLRVYVDLFAGSGRARIRETGEVVPGSPLLALRIPDRFDRYVFCDASAENIAALRERVSATAPDVDVVFVPGEVNAAVSEIGSHIPQSRKGRSVLSFCFVDPFSVNIRFETIRALSSKRPMDFLILLALGMDANRNLAAYLRAESTRIADFLGNPQWREEWKLESATRRVNFMLFLAEQYAHSMARIGYLPTTPDKMYHVRSTLKNLPLYYLAFFSKHELGYKLWEQVRKYSTDQLDLLS